MQLPFLCNKDADLCHFVAKEWMGSRRSGIGRWVSVQVPNIDLNSTRVQEIHDIQMSNLLISCTERVPLALSCMSILIYL